MATTHCVIIATCATELDAAELARGLLAKRLAACVQIMPMKSHYAWKGEIVQEAESLLLIKTKSQLYADIEKHIRENHKYEIPEIIKLPIERGLPQYLRWIDESTK